MHITRKEIQQDFSESHYIDFGQHKDLIALCVCPSKESFDENGNRIFSDFEEVVFIVEKEWLFTYIKTYYPNLQNEVDIRHWLQNEYTSEDSEPIFDAALLAQKIVMIDFD